MKINGEAFQKARENQLLSTIGLAKMADVSPNVIRSLEQGNNIRPESIRKIIEALGLTIEDAQKKGLIKT
ncbi:MAG: helix-turn-helix domain-containing protein [Deltaproteobacteria bacterium]|jgi:ribosome-binding protein aMBF1 (putative translation factor)|nr:helix-turn-helix domain-containing protein [Deltaproteobacteria bacterium]